MGMLRNAVAWLAGRLHADPAPSDPDKAAVAGPEDHLMALAQGANGRIMSAPEESLSAPERVFRRVWTLEAEVNNGGFDQFFLNVAGRHAPETVEALRTIGARAAAGLVAGAIKVLGTDVVWAMDSARREALDDLGEAAREKLEALDERFCSYPNDLTGLLHGYVVRHASEFASAPGGPT
jgi:Domain of unknown function (DUF4375)